VYWHEYFAYAHVRIEPDVLEDTAETPAAVGHV
jgi:hypothetical protein